MAQVSFYKGLLSNLPDTISEGSVYVITDKPSLYVDVSPTDRIKVTDVTVVDALQNLPQTVDQVKTTFYYISDENSLVTWSNTMAGFVRINIDTGATAAKLAEAQTGNAVTNITYDAAKRELVFEKGLAFVTEEKIGNLNSLTTKTKESIVSAINEINAAVVEGATGIKNMYMDENGNLICVLTNDSEINVGQIPNYREITVINGGTSVL